MGLNDDKPDSSQSWKKVRGGRAEWFRQLSHFSDVADMFGFDNFQRCCAFDFMCSCRCNGVCGPSLFRCAVSISVSVTHMDVCVLSGIYVYEYTYGDTMVNSVTIRAWVGVGLRRASRF